MDKEGDEVAEEKMELEQHVAIHGQLGDLTVLQGNNRLCGQRGIGHARPRAVPADGGKPRYCDVARVETIGQRDTSAASMRSGPSGVGMRSGGSLGVCFSSGKPGLTWRGIAPL